MDGRTPGVESKGHASATDDSETLLSTMAPNVGLPSSSVGAEWTEVKFRRDTGCASRDRPSARELSTPGDFAPKTSKHVTLRHGYRKSRRSPSSSSADSSDGEYAGRFVTRSERHTPPRDPPPPCGGISGRHTPPVEQTGEGRRSGRSVGRAPLRRRSEPVDESPRRQGGEREQPKRVLPTVKLGTYNGSTCLKTFLAKFENCSDYYTWDDRERLCHLRACLEGPAGQVLWDAGQQSSVDEVIRLLINRFGSLNEEERYRCELKARRRRRRGESLQSVYQDIRRLMALAFPGQSGPLWEIIARDAFVESLGDPTLRLRVLERDPETLEQALKLASRLEALGYGDKEDTWDDVGRRKDRFVKASSAQETTALATLVQELTAELKQNRRERERLRKAGEGARGGSECMAGMVDESARPARFSDQPVGGCSTREWRTSPLAPLQAPPFWQAPPSDPPLLREPPATMSAEWMSPSMPPPAVDRYWLGQRPEVVRTPPSRQAPFAEGTPSRMQPRDRINDRCHYCRQRGHWKAECPEREQRPRVQGAHSQNTGARTYLTISVAGRSSTCLLDTGCDLSMLPRRFVPTTPLEPTGTRVFAVNGTRIPVMGAVTIRFDVAGVPVQCRFLVSNAVDEPLLGIDWLEGNNCTWDFVHGKLLIAGQEVPLVGRPRRSVVRRAYVMEDVVIPTRSQVNVPVRLTWTVFEKGANDTEWVMDPKHTPQGVIVARSLLPKEGTKTFVRAANLSDEPCGLPTDLCVGGAYPAVVVSDREGAAVASPATIIEGPATSNGPATSPAAFTGGPATFANPAASGSGNFDHLQPVIDSFTHTLSVTERATAEHLVHDFADVFSRSEFDLGHTNLLPHRIDTGDARPFKEQLRRHPIAHLDFIDSQVEQMLRAGVIEPSSSPWSSNVVLAKKSDGSLRFCVDYRRLNDLTYKDSFPLPRIDTCLDALGGSMYFSTMDLRSGFWQVSIDPRDADKTAFVTRKGQFRFRVLSFGLANSPSIFQRLMTMVLAGLHWDICLVYIDDIVVMGRNFQEHVRNVAQVFQRLRLAGLKLKPSKCQLFQERVRFLGHVISSQGVEPDPEKISCIADWPEPRSLTEVRSFLGLASYYRNFVENFGEVARPLYELTRKNAPFIWDDRRRQAFDTLKVRLCSAPVLAAPTPDGDFVLDVDACSYGAGAILHQRQTGVLRVIAYASCQFNKAERSYCTTRQELAAVVFGLRRFRQYLLGRRVLVRSDHAALTYLRQTKEPVGQQARWLDFVEQFDLVVQHRSGSANRAADALSRRPCETSGPCGQCSKGARPLMARLAAESEDWEAVVCPGPICATVVTRRQARERAGKRGNGTPPVSAGAPPLLDEPVPPLAGAPPLLSEAPPLLHVAPPLSAEAPPILDEPVPLLVGDPPLAVHDKSPELLAGPSSGWSGPAPDLPFVSGRDGDPPSEEASQHRAPPPTNNDPVEVGWTNEEMRRLQQEDANIGPVVAGLQTGLRPPLGDLDLCDPEIKCYRKQWDSLTLVDGLVYRRFERPNGTCQYLQLLIPRLLRHVFLRMIHELSTGHLGYEKTLEQVQRRAYWASWKTDVKLYCGCCRPCSEFHRGRPPRQARLKPLFAGAPMEVLHVDLTGPHVSSQGYKYMMTACDSFTRFVIAVPLRNKTALSVARALIHEVILKYGVLPVFSQILAESFRTNSGQSYVGCWASLVCALLHTLPRRTGRWRGGTVHCIL